MIRININLLFVLITANIWIYVGYAAASGQNSFYDNLSSVFISISCAAYWFLFRGEKYVFAVTLEKQKLVKFAVVFITAAILLKNRLSEDISGDQLYYANYAFIHAQKIYEYIGDFLRLHDELSYKNVLRILNVVIAFSCILLIFILRRVFNYKLITTITIFVFVLIGRLIIIKILSGSSYIHPPLQLLPISLSGTILGINNSSFRLPALVTLIISFFILQRITKDNTDSKWVYWLVPLAVTTTPLLLHVGSLNESSIYGYLGAITFYAILYEKSVRNSRQNTLLYVTILLLLAFLRISNFVYLFIYIALIFVDCLQKRRDYEQWKIFSLSVLISLSLLPLLLDAIVFGTPATTGLKLSDLADPIESYSLYYFIDLAKLTIFSALSPTWSIGLFLLITGILFSKTRVLAIVTILVFVCQILLFFNINLELISELRYKAEYFYPFCVLGFVQFIIYFPFTKFKRLFIFAISIIAGVIIIFNVRTFPGYPHNYRDLAADSFLTRSAEVVWDYSSALNFVVKNGQVENVLLAGQTNGIMIPTMMGFTVSQIVSQKMLSDRYFELGQGDWLNYDYEAILNIKPIRYLIVSDIMNRDEVIYGLLRNNWDAVLGNPENSDQIIVLERQSEYER